MPRQGSVFLTRPMARHLLSGRSPSHEAAFKRGWLRGMTEKEEGIGRASGASPRATPQRRDPPAWLAACVDLLRVEYARPLTIAAVAARLNVHPTHLSRVFRKRFGLTMGEYLNLVRVRSACERLQLGNSALVVVALETGFSDQSHLCRVFKKLVGCTPGRFRELNGCHSRRRWTSRRTRSWRSGGAP